MTPLTSAVFEHPRVSPAHSKSHLWDRSLLPRVPERLGKGCHKFWGGGARAVTVAEGTGTAQALEITEPPCFVFSSPAANRLTDPALRICFGKGGMGGVTSGKLHLGQLYFRAGFRSSSSPFFFFFSSHFPLFSF